MGNYSPHANYKCKCYLLYAKPQGDDTSHLSEFLSSKRAQTTNVGWWVGKKRQPLYTVGGTVNLYSHCGIVWKKKLKTELPCDPAVPLPGIYPRTRTVIWKGIVIIIPKIYAKSILLVHQEMNA